MIIDLHSHILPYIDDGARNWEETLEMGRIAESEGITHMVCTPHYIFKEAEYDLAYYGGILREAQELLVDNHLKLKLIRGCEVYFSTDIIENINQSSLLSINDGKKYLLVEFGRADIPNYTKDIIFQLKMQGITPIIAHPERNMVLSEKPELVAELIEQGSLCQVNTGSITGDFGKKAARNAIYLLKAGMVHLLGSDAHSSKKRPPYFQKAIRHIREVIPEERLYEIIHTNPQKIINGENLNPYPVELYKGKLWERITKNFRIGSL